MGDSGDQVIMRAGANPTSEVPTHSSAYVSTVRHSRLRHVHLASDGAAAAGKWGSKAQHRLGLFSVQWIHTQSEANLLILAYLDDINMPDELFLMRPF